MRKGGRLLLFGKYYLIALGICKMMQYVEIRFFDQDFFFGDPFILTKSEIASIEMYEKT